MLVLYFVSGMWYTVGNGEFIISRNMCKSVRNIIGQEFAYKEEGHFFSFLKKGRSKSLPFTINN